MFQQLVIRVKNRQFMLYQDSFGFFHSKPINNILTFRKIDHVILFRDLEFIDNYTEFLKRTYCDIQGCERMKKLINYYYKNMALPSPSLLTLEQYPYLDNRNRKMLELHMEQKSQQQKSKSNLLKISNSSSSDILDKLNQTFLQNLSDSQLFGSQEQSYDSDVHCIYDNFHHSNNNLFNSVNYCENKQILSLNNVKQSQLIINLSHLNNVEVLNPLNKAKLSFMEYYHSIPVKNSTNIIENYIKRKK